MNKFIQMAIMAAVGVVLIFSLCMPVITSATADTKTIANEGAYFAEPDGENHTLVFSKEKVTVDGVDVPYPEGFGTGNARNATVAIGTDWILRLDMGYARLVLAGPNNLWKPLGNPATNDITLTISGTTLNYTAGGNPATVDDLVYYLAPSGDMVLCYNPYILEDSLIVGAIRNNDNTALADIFEIVAGTVEDGYTVVPCRVTYTADNSNTTFTSTETTNTESVTTNLLKLTNITQDVTMANSATATLYLSYVLAPATIEYTNPDKVDSTMESLLNLVPLLLIVSIVLAIVLYSVRARLS